MGDFEVQLFDVFSVFSKFSKIDQISHILGKIQYFVKTSSLPYLPLRGLLDFENLL